MAGILTKTDQKTLLLLKPRGFCAGVVRAIDVVRIALEAFGPPIYVRKEIVHNRFVVEELQGKGAIFVEELAEIPDNTNAPVVNGRITHSAAETISPLRKKPPPSSTAKTRCLTASASFTARTACRPKCASIARSAACG